MRRSLVLCLALLAWAAVSSAAEQPLKIRVSAAGGFDNNRGLNSERKGDGFAQETVSLAYARLLDAKAQVRLSYNALNLNYFEATDLNLLLNEVGAGFRYLLAPSTIWESDYTFQYLYFPENDAVTSFENEVSTGLRQKMTDRWTLKGLVAYSEREYESKKASGPDRLDTSSERADDRLSGEISSVYRVRKDLIFSSAATLYTNDSNDQFHNYYDYDAYKLSAGLSWQIDPKWLCFAKFTFEERDYDLRPLRDSQDTQEDQLYTTTLSLYYKINKDLSVGSLVTYRQKESNEPSQRYSGSIGTLGLYYSF